VLVALQANTIPITVNTVRQDTKDAIDTRREAKNHRTTRCGEEACLPKLGCLGEEYLPCVGEELSFLREGFREGSARREKPIRFALLSESKPLVEARGSTWYSALSLMRDLRTR